MVSIEIDNIKNFTARLFAGTDFDSFLALEAEFATVCTFTIDGHINAEFVGEEDMKLPENREGIVSWNKLRPICYEIIKGKKIPRQFTIILMYPYQNVCEFLQTAVNGTAVQDIRGLYLNIHFKQGRLYCTTGCSLKTFSLDRKVETAWDDYVTEYLKQYR